MIAAIVLAAGTSRRMGANKLLLPYRGKVVIEHIVDEAIAAAFAPVVLVTGHYETEVRTALAGQNLVWAHNADYEKGMLSSIRCGIRALPAGVRAFAVLLGDQPAINTAMLKTLLKAFNAGTHGIVVPTFGRRSGHPIVISATYRDMILARFDDTGLRGLLSDQPGAVLRVPASTDAILRDMDTPEEYRRELEIQR